MTRSYRISASIFLAVVVWLTQAAGKGVSAESVLELVAQTGHSEWLSAVAIGGDGKQVLTGSADHTAILWDAETGKQLQQYKGHTNAVVSVAISADRKRILAGSGDKHGRQGSSGGDTLALLWDTETGKLLQKFAGHENRVYSVALSANGKRALTGSADGTAILWDAESGKQLQKFTGVTSTVALSRDGQRVVAGTGDKTAILWDADTGTKLRVFEGHSGRVVCVALSTDCKRLLTASEDKTAILWDATAGTKLQTFQGHTDTITSVALTADGQRVFTGSRDRTVILWDVTTGKKIRTFDGAVEGFWSVASCSDDGKQFATTSENKTALLWDSASGEKVQTFAGRISWVSRVALSEDGKCLLMRTETGVRLWDTTLGVPLPVFQENTEIDGPVALSADGKQLLTGTVDRAVVLWDAVTGAKLRTYGQHSGMLGFVNLSDDGKRIHTGCFAYNAGIIDLESNALFRFDGATGKKLQTYYPPQFHSLYSAAVSDDGTRFITGGEGAVLWDGTTGKTIGTLEGHKGRIIAVALSPDGKRGVTGSMDKTAILWDSATGTKLRTFAGHTGLVSAVAFSSDGKQVLTGSRDGTAILWETATGKKLNTLEGHSAAVYSVALNKEGTRVVTASADGTTRLWDAETGRELCKLLSLDAGKEWLVITPDGLFDSSVNATRFLSYRIVSTLEFVPLERYQQKYYQPRLLTLLMKGELPTPKVDVAKSIPPKVRFAETIKPGLEIKDGKLTVEAIAQTRGDFPIKTFRLLVDSRPYRGQLGVQKVADPKVGVSSVKWTIELEPGRHTLKVLADTEYVQGATDEVEVRYIGGGAQADLELPTLYVLAVGISKYSGTRRLDYAARDAQAVAQAYQKHSKTLFKNVEVNVITDEQASRKGIFEGMQWLREKMTPKTVGVFFFAGHGEKDKDESLYFLPVDFEEKNLAGSAIDADVLRKQLVGIPGRLTLILDACHAGGIDQGKKRGVGGLTDQLVRDLMAEESGLIVMCSALGGEQAQESHQFRHGLFTVALLEGLEGKGNGKTGKDELKVNTSKDGAVYLTALDAYTAARVKELSNGQQNPVTGKPTSVRDFPISKP